MGEGRGSEGAAVRNQTTAERVSDREVLVTRTFEAPARLVFEAWTRPELLARWWVPKSMGMTLLSVDAEVRAGGTYRFVFSMGDAPPMAFFGRYLEVTPPSRLVWTNEESGDDGPVTTLTLDEREGRTHLILRELYPSKEALDAAGTGAAEALRETFAQLDELLAEGGAAGR